MKISSVTNLATYPVNSFLQASFKGKAAVVASAITLIYLMALWLSKSFRDATSTSLAGRVQSTNTVLPQEIPKPDLSYIKTSVVVPDFVKISGFGRWLLQKMEEFGPLSQGVRAKDKDTLFWVTMNQLHKDIKKRADTMKPVFEKLPNFTEEGWKAFCTNCQAIIRPNSQAQNTAEESCKKLDECLAKLQAWDKALQTEYQRQFMERMKDKDTYPHYEFANLQTQYLHYLGLKTNDDFSKLSPIKVPYPVNYLMAVGLVKMEDVDALELRTMMPWIEKLRQLFCYLDITKHLHASLINEAIEACRDVLKSSENLADCLGNKEELTDSVRQMRTSFRTLSQTDANIPLDKFLAQLKEIEQQDIARQLILLKGYFHQQNLLSAWRSYREQGVAGLAQYAQGIENQSLKLLYQMG
ncbi:MAG TPA: hypothetical protein VFU89_02470 [Rhabdochlamydiaceae bacterium]|nr:hypothetical protein [Rhabdochlamydiaceae bacterium]